VGVVGAGKFGTMFLAQARTTAGMHVVAVADLNVERARSQLKMASWPDGQAGAASLDDAIQSGRTCLTDDTEAMIAHPAIEVIVEALSREPERSHKGPDDGLVQAAAVAICHACIASALKVRRVLTGGKVRATLYALAFSVPST
jgi:hypothetical protein